MTTFSSLSRADKLTVALGLFGYGPSHVITAADFDNLGGNPAAADRAHDPQQLPKQLHRLLGLVFAVVFADPRNPDHRRHVSCVELRRTEREQQCLFVLLAEPVPHPETALIPNDLVLIPEPSRLDGRCQRVR
jgi:hypothetical protein